MPRILLIAGLNGDFAALAMQAKQCGAVISQADTIATGLDILRRTPSIALIVADIALDTPTLMQSLRTERFTVPVLVAGRDPDPMQAEAAVRAGARDVLCLPTEPQVLAGALACLPDAAVPLTTRNAPALRDPAMLAVLRRAEQIAFSDASVLITGESGTGKEVIARLIHAKSKRTNGPFVAINCAAIPEALLESELFGHEKGAFSGALARRLGKFEAASGGTLLLDEISEMHVRLQAKLLRAIQEREIDRVGGSAPVRINVRILATSNRNLPAEASAGRFREDLYFRLNVVSVRIPPLRDRPADIATLAAHFARHYAELNGVPHRPLSAAALARLRANPWRGNVRELENTIHRAVLLAPGTEINAADIDGPDLNIPDLNTNDPTMPNMASTRGDPGDNTGEPQTQSPFAASDYIGRPMAEVERDHILHTLTHTFGNRTHAATMLGISIRALRNKLKDYSQAGIAVPPPQAGIAA